MSDWVPLYQLLWKGRTVSDPEEAMKNELLDKLNHPRLRKTPQVKFAEAVRRVCDGPFSDTEKMKLITAYIHTLENIKQKD